MRFRFVSLTLGVLLVLSSGAINLVTAISQQIDQSENPPLVVAENSLSSLFADRAPRIQPGFKNPHDVWLLYSPYFDVLSGSSQSYLLRKYGLLGDEPDSDSLQYKQALTAYRLKLGVDIAGLAGENVRVNNPAADLRQRVQSETSSATFGSNIVVGYNDTSAAGFGSGISFSNDGGRTWKQTLPPIYPFGSGLGDPVMAAGPDGVFYYAQLAANGLGLSTIGVTRSTDGGASWSPLMNATMNRTTRFDFHDKDWMAVDNTDSRFRGNIYVSWTRFTSEPRERTGIGFVRSTDGGKTWSQFKLIGRPADERGLVQGSMIAVGPNGEVYVAYWDSRVPGIAVVKSTDGGQSFGPPVVALRHQSMRFSRNLSGGFDNPHFPSIAVDTSRGRNRGTVYITANIKPSDSDDSDVVLVKSTDGGATWSMPVRVNDDLTDTDQFQPSLAVAADGTLGLMWYDRRNDPVNNVLIDVYMAISVDGGNTFSANRRVTSGNWMLVPTPFGLRTGYHGDYNQMSAGDLGFVLNWGDDRSGTDPDVYVTVISPDEARIRQSDFVLSSRTLSRNLLSGSKASFVIGSSATGGFAILGSPIRLEAVPPYPGLRYGFSSSTIAPNGETTLTVEAAPDAEPGTYPITIVGRAGGLVRTTNLRLNVYNPRELGQTPSAISGIRDSVFRPKAVVDEGNDLHVISGSDPGRFFSSFGALNYTRYRRGVPIVSTTITRAASDPRAAAMPLSDHAIGVDGSGNITAVWLQFDPETSISNIFVSRSTDGGRTFSDPVNVSGISDRRIMVSSPALAVSKAGAINIAFVQLDATSSPPSQDVFLIRSIDGGSTFSSKVNVSRSPAPSPMAFATAPSVAVDQSEAVSIAYLAATGPTRRADIFFARSIDGVSFSAPVNISRTNTANTAVLNVASPSIAIDRSGDIHVVYIKFDLDRNEQDVYFSRSTDGGRTFSEPINVSKTAALGIRSFVPNVGADTAGNIGIAWEVLGPGRLFPGGRDIFFARSIDGGRTFSPAINVSNNIGQQAALPIVITDEEGRLAALWEDDTGGNNQIHAIAP